MLTEFPPLRFTALRRALSVNATDYARTRNQIDGKVTRLSPYLTHGLVRPGELLECWRMRFGLTLRDTLCLELAWREYFQHIWRHRAEGILEDIHPIRARASDIATLASDIRHAATGVPVVDRSVRELYSTGYLHRRQRMWVASYCVHVRKQPWRIAADWLYGHLLDGDLGSNHLSWQQVAGSLGGSPYVLDNANVRSFAPALDSRGSVIDRSNAQMRELARSAPDEAASNVLGLPTREPALLNRPPGLVATASLSNLVRGRRIALIHPWMLDRRPAAELCIGVIHLPFHARFPWSERRWDFVLSRMRALCDAFFVGDLTQSRQWLDQIGAGVSEATLNFGYADVLRHERVRLPAATHALPEPGALCASFEVWMRTLLRDAPELFEHSVADQLARLRRD